MPLPNQSSARLEPLPDAGVLDNVLHFLRTQRRLSAISRKSGDEAQMVGETKKAIEKWETSSRQNLHALKGARSYVGFRALFDQEGVPVRGRNYPLEGAEAEFAKLYCDTLGRQGGLYRRLGFLNEAREYYRLGSVIEARSADLAFENSYNTLNAISIMIELGQKSASPLGHNGWPDLQRDILAAREMVNAQICLGTRGNDAWAMADLAFAIMLSNDPKAFDDYVPQYYDRYAAKADIDDIQTTLRILRRVMEKLREMGDPVAVQIEQGIARLRGAAFKADKIVD
jgi:tetratricopeptide (TPR) repeat protein